MAAEISVFQCVVVTIDGVPFGDFGSLKLPAKGIAAAIAAGTNPIRKIVKVPAASKITGWLWADTSGFNYLAVRPVVPAGGEAEGFIQVGVRYSKATTPADDADLTPLGTTPKWIDLSKSCVGAFELDSERAYLDTVSDAKNSTETTSYPTVWGSADRSLGVADKLAFWNESATDAVLVELLIVPK